MNRIFLFLLAGLTLEVAQVSGQTFKEQFNELLSNKDTSGQRLLLEKWEKADSADAELFVSYFNYYVVRSKQELLRLGQDPQGKEALQIMDQDTSKKEPVGFIFSDTYYDPELLSKGFDWIAKGIKKHPNRLDMRFGRIYMFGQIEDYETFTKEIIQTIDYSAMNKNAWTWSDSELLDDPKEFMLSSIQGYQMQLYNTGNDDLLPNMKRIAEAVLNHYPDHVESLSNLSIVYVLQGEYDKAFEPLLKAEKLAPTDYIVLGNIAQTYKRKGDVKNAIKYYELTLKYGNPQTKKYAQEQIDELKQK